MEIKCPHCGDDKDVIESYEHIGGQGEVLVLQCRDQVKCWERWDEEHGLSSREKT